MHMPAIPPLIWALLYPNPRSGDPTTLPAHISRYIVPEVREETMRYHGLDGGLEAQYPGLDYTNPRHRKRLSWFPHHRRLFRVFDELRLTPSEIKSLCRWEGTLYLKERFERETGTCIPDSAWPYSDPPPVRTPTAYLTPHEVAPMVPSLPFASSEALPIPDSPMIDLDQQAQIECDMLDVIDEEQDRVEQEKEDDDIISNVSSEDTLSYSVGVELNQRLIAATAARARGEEVVLDADWEQWLKEAAERDADSPAASFLVSGSRNTSPPQAGSSSQTVWTNEIPDLFRRGQTTMTPAELATVRAMLPPPPPYVNPARLRVPVDTAAEGAEPQVRTAM